MENIKIDKLPVVGPKWPQRRWNGINIKQGLRVKREHILIPNLHR